MSPRCMIPVVVMFFFTTVEAGEVAIGGAEGEHVRLEGVELLTLVIGGRLFPHRKVIQAGTEVS